MNSPKFSQDPYQSSGSSESRSSVAQAARNTASKIGNAASETASKVKDSAERLVSDKKETAANRVGAYSSAIHESARSLEQEDPNIAWLTHRAADRLDSVASYIRTRDFRGLRDDAASLARRHPAAFFGGMCIAGLVLGSVIRAARSATTESSYSSDNLETENFSGESDYPSYMAESPSSAGTSGSSLEGTSGSSFEDRQARGTSASPEI
jgi:hypothetical protein